MLMRLRLSGSEAGSSNPEIGTRVPRMAPMLKHIYMGRLGLANGLRTQELSSSASVPSEVAPLEVSPSAPQLRGRRELPTSSKSREAEHISFSQLLKLKRRLFSEGNHSKGTKAEPDNSYVSEGPFAKAQGSPHNMISKIGGIQLDQQDKGKKLLGNFYMEILEQKFRSSYGSMPLKGGDGPPMELPGVTCDTRAEPDKCSEEAGMSKDMSGSKSPKELRRSCYIDEMTATDMQTQGGKDNTPMRKASELEISLEDGEVAPPKEDMIRHHLKKDKSTICPDQHTTPKREGKELMTQDEAIKGATQPENI
ncbi:hypothetical protein Tco_0046326 [Tanacetum coccineum]